jgi:hypothetical protein
MMVTARLTPIRDGGHLASAESVVSSLLSALVAHATAGWSTPSRAAPGRSR